MPIDHVQVLWLGLFERHGARLSTEFDLTSLAHITEGYSSGTLDMVVRSMLTKRRKERFEQGEQVTLPEILQWLCKVRIGGSTSLAAQAVHALFPRER